MLQEEVEKANASAHIFEAELEETKGQLLDAKKGETSQEKKEESEFVVLYLPKKMKKGGPEDGSRPKPVA